MKALLLKDYSKLEYTDLPTPEPAEDEVLIRIKACSICGSDVHGSLGGNGRRIPPIVMGHEASGIIEKLGSSVTDYQVGECVTFDSTQYCGKCQNCRNGMTNLCENRRIVGVSSVDYKKDGAMAEYITVKAHTLYRIPDEVSFEDACLIEPFAVGLHAVELAGCKDTDTAVIIGDGTIGLMTLQAAAAKGLRKIVLIGRHEKRLQAAKEIAGDIVTVIDSSKESAAPIIHEVMGNAGVNVVFDAVGMNTSMKDAFSYVKNGGKIICIGNVSPIVDFPLQECVVRQIQVIGSYSSAGEYELGLRYMKEQKVNFAPFTTNILPLSKGAEAFDMLLHQRDEILKIVLSV